jgi:hypothetical protein
MERRLFLRRFRPEYGLCIGTCFMEPKRMELGRNARKYDFLANVEQKSIFMYNWEKPHPARESRQSSSLDKFIYAD